MDIHGLGEAAGSRMATFNQSRHLFDFESSDKRWMPFFPRLEVVKHTFIQTQDETNMSFDQNFVEKHWQTTGVIKTLPNILCKKNQTIEMCFPYAFVWVGKYNDNDPSTRSLKITTLDPTPRSSHGGSPGQPRE